MMFQQVRLHNICTLNRGSLIAARLLRACLIICEASRAGVPRPPGHNVPCVDCFVQALTKQSRICFRGHQYALLLLLMLHVSPLLCFALQSTTIVTHEAGYCPVVLSPSGREHQ